MQHIGDRIREYRMLHGLTQEGLAEKADMHPNTIKKLEQGGTARMDTLHRIARALNTTTGSLISSRPRLLEHGDDGKLDLLDLRRTISPPITVDGDPLCDDTEPPDLPALKDALARLDAAYHGDRYTDLAEILPGLIRSAHTAVAHHAHTPREAEARRLRSVALQIAARYLTQVRAYDLAHLALADATRDAAASGDEMVSVHGDGWGDGAAQVEQVEFAVVAVFQQSGSAGDEAAGGCVEGTGDAVEGVHARGAALLELFDGVGVHARLLGEVFLGEAVEHAVFADAVSDMLHECGPVFPGVWLFPG